jgi:hypothetical protein
MRLAGSKTAILSECILAQRAPSVFYLVWRMSLKKLIVVTDHSCQCEDLCVQVVADELHEDSLRERRLEAPHGLACDFLPSKFKTPTVRDVKIGAELDDLRNREIRFNARLSEIYSLLWCCEVFSVNSNVCCMCLWPALRGVLVPLSWRRGHK